MDSQLLATLQSLMTGTEAADLEPPRLKSFYRHCARRPLMHDGRHVSLPLKTLLLNYSHLRPEVKASLDKALHERWRLFTAERPQPSPGVIGDRPAPEFASPPTLPSNVAPPADSCADARPVTEDWFDRFLNGVRCLLFF